MKILQTLMTRRRFLQGSAMAGAAGAAAGGLSGLVPASEAQAQAQAQSLRGETVITKNICAQCPARCGIDVYTTNGRVHAIYGDTGNPIANGKLCPKGHLGTYFLYDPDRFKGPMKRTNPRKGRNEDPGFVPISWDEALDTIAARLNNLRDAGESHRFALFYGRGWGASDAGLQGDFGKLYGSPNVAIGHASMCAEGSKRAKQATDGNNSYNAYDYRNVNYILNFGASFLEAFRPYNYLMQMWGHMRSKSPQTRITTVDVRMNPTMAASDRALYIKPATDGAMALAIAHVILTEGLWDREFVGDFYDPDMRFRAGQRIPEYSFAEKWMHGLTEWWNEELKDRTPEWAESITSISARDILRTAREFGTTRPAIAIMERGPTAHTNGTYNGMANIYTLAEDALNSVPGHLRAGSLAAGATPWQTAMWIILPTAASGVFSAVMIGMGRAVGETMIVVMAAGNTPIMEWNIFSGLRTLSANIAIELPEAVKDGTNYRTLFLAALTLFIMTFVINTVAELIRQRFRKRAFQL